MLKKRFLPLTLATLSLTGCGFEHTAPAPAAQVTAETAPAVKEPVQKQEVRLPDEEIDFTRVRIEADLSEQMIYVLEDSEIVRSMITSSGLDKIPNNSTPRGEFVIEPERGEWFYAPQYSEGAKYWVSFQNHGEFLFHSLVMDENQQILAAEAAKLGQKASHGCFRLKVEDAKWIYDNIPTGTRVIIRD